MRAGIDESQVYFTNALSCRPPIGKPPDSKAIDACHPRLVEEIRAYDRQVIITLGNSALRSLTGNHGLKITHERGKAIQNGVGTVVHTFHPALILRSFGQFPQFVADLKYAATFLNGGVVKIMGDTKWDLVTRENFDKVTKFLLKQPYLGADIETGGFNPRGDEVLCLSVSWAPNRAAVFPLMHPKDPNPLWDQSMVYFDKMQAFLEAPGPRWIWHNGKFDASFFHEMEIDARVDEDCMLLHYTQTEIRGTHDLAQLGSDFLGAPNWKDKMAEDAIRVGDIKSKKQSYRNIRPAILYPYNARDADVTLQLFHKLMEKQEAGAGSMKLYRHLLIPASKFLREVESTGIYVNTGYMDEAEKAYRERLAVERKDILTEVDPIWNPHAYARAMGAVKVPKTFNPGSPKQLLYVLRNLKGYRIRNTRDETLRELPSSDPLVAALRKHRKTDKVIGTYIEGVQNRIEDDGRVHSTFLIHGTTTGRLSSRNPNMQNVPRDATIRNVFQSAPGHKLIELDYSQVELRVLAVFSQDEVLMQDFYEGRDLHDEVAAALYPGWRNRKETVQGKEERIRAKFLNFGVAYGRGAKSLVDEFKMEMSEASSIVREWFRRIPKAATFISECRAAPSEGRVLQTPFGRRRRFGLVTKDNLNHLENEAVNFPMQSTASDLTLLSAIRASQMIGQTWEAHVVNLVHDSILLEVPEYVDIPGLVEYVVGVMSEIPRTVLKTDMPFKVDVKEGTRWGDLKI
jgi:DNA polymerase-1